MGCLCSKGPSDFTGTRSALQAGIPVPSDQRKRRQEEKVQRQLQKLQKRNARKRRKMCRQGRAPIVRSPKGSLQRQSATAPHPPVQLRLMGGSNGSSATECWSALYARTLEQQREEHHQTVEQGTLQQLDRDLHTFLLNQLLLAIQFFANFEAELALVDAELKHRSARSTEEHRLLQSSAIDAAVARNLRYKPTSAKAAAQPLQKPLTYVVFENVDMARPQEADYDSISPCLCKVLLETDYYSTTPCATELVQMMEKTRWMGYVRLKLRGEHRMPQPAEEEGDLYTDAGSVSSGYSSTDYDHVHLARLNSLRPLEELQLKGDFPLESSKLPESCIRRLASCLPSWLLESDSEEEEDDEGQDSSYSDVESQDDEDANANEDNPPAGYEKVQVLRQYRVEEQLQACYLSSQQFMFYFGHILRRKLASELGITQAQLKSGTYCGCSVYTSREVLVPAIHVAHSWPDCAFEFGLRARARLTNLHTGEQYQWPTDAVRNKIRSFGYHLVPVGFTPKHGKNPFRDIEWRVVFPQAEQYLERHCLTPMQLKVFQLTKLLVRTFVEKSCDLSPGVLLEQLRCHLFWECERSSNDWPEEFLGDRLVRFIRSFDACLARKDLRDYFIERRNLFEHIPEDTLMRMRTVMAAIAEQPLWHVVHALRNLQHSPDFYPPLDYNRLWDNLCSQDYLQLHAWGKFSKPRPGFPQPESEAEPTVRKPQERSRGKGRRRTQQKLQQAKSQETEPRKSSLDCLDEFLSLPCSNAKMTSSSSPDNGVSGKLQLNNGLEILRRSNLLELLLDNLLARLDRAIGFGNRSHAQLNLEHGQRLCRLYQHLGCSQQSQHFVQELQKAAARMEDMDETPVLPQSSAVSEDRPPQKHITFDEHVVEIHLPNMQRSVPEAPKRIPRNPAQKTSIQEADAIEAIEVTKEPVEPADTSQDEQSSQENLFSLNKLLQSVHLRSDKVQDLGNKTVQLIQKVTPSEAKKEELRESFKRNTQKLNQFKELICS